MQWICHSSYSSPSLSLQFIRFDAHVQPLNMFRLFLSPSRYTCDERRLQHRYTSVCWRGREEEKSLPNLISSSQMNILIRHWKRDNEVSDFSLHLSSSPLSLSLDGCCWWVGRGSKRRTFVRVQQPTVRLRLHSYEYVRAYVRVTRRRRRSSEVENSLWVYLRIFLPSLCRFRSAGPIDRRSDRWFVSLLSADRSSSLFIVRLKMIN